MTSRSDFEKLFWEVGYPCKKAPKSGLKKPYSVKRYAVYNFDRLFAVFARRREATAFCKALTGEPWYKSCTYMQIYTVAVVPESIMLKGVTSGISPWPQGTYVKGNPDDTTTNPAPALR
jgi:hypothetical protein